MNKLNPDPSESNKILVSGINIEWNTRHGTCTFEKLPVAMMWVDTTLAGLMAGVQDMVGMERFVLALQSEGRKSVEADWQVISQFSDFHEGFKAIANIAAVAGWGQWMLTALDEEKKECHFRVKDSWEGRYQKALGVCWGSGMLAGKMAGYCTKLFGTNCWAEQTAFIAKGDKYDELVVKPSKRSIEKEIESLLESDEATRADMAIALQKLRKEISERMRAEEALRKSEKKFYKAFYSSPAPISITRMSDGLLIETNDALEKMFGYPRDEYIGHTVYELGLWADPKDRERLLQLISADGAVHDEEFKFRAKDGHVLRARYSAEVIEVEGEPCILSLLIDETERKRAEEALKKTESEKRIILDSMAEMLAYYNSKDLKIQWVNRASGESVNMSPQDLIGRRCYEIWHKRNKPCEICPVSRAFEIGKDQEDEVTSPDGKVWHIRAYPVLDAKGETEGVVELTQDITDRKLAEKALLESEKRYRDLADLLPQTVFEMDTQGRLTYVNHVAFNMFGYTPKDFEKNLNALDVLIPEDRARAWVNLKRLIEGENLSGEEYIAMRKDGTKFNVIISANVILHNGITTGFRGIVIDITERKLAEKRQGLALKILELLNSPSEREDIFREIVLQIKNYLGIEAIGIRLREGDDFPYYTTNGFPPCFLEAERYLCVRNQLGEIIRDSKGNPYLECMCGNVICGRIDPAFPFFTQGGSFWTNSTSKLLASTTEQDRQARTRNRCNGEGYESVALIPLKSEDRTIGLLQLNDKRTGVFTLDLINFLEGLGSSVGIALERKMAEEALRESEERFRNISEYSPFPISIIDQDGKYLYINKKFVEIFGYTLKDMATGREWFELAFPDQKYRREAIATWKRDLEKIDQGMARSRTYNVMCKAGTVREVNFMPVSMGYGKQFVIYEDLTEHRQLEEERAKAAKLESVGLLAGGIAHDFNNILTAILGNISLGKMIAKDNETIDIITEAEKACVRASDLTRQLLTFAKGGEPIKKTISVKELAEESVVFALRGSNVRCDFSIPEETWLVYADEGQIHQVINNIVINAKQAMPKGGAISIMVENVTVSLGDSLPLEEGKYVKIGIEDHGIGVPKGNLNKIFDPYFTTKQKGSGLGLATSYSIVKRHGGIITVESKPGIGTTFYIYLPASKGQVQVEEDNQEKMALTKMKILVMDDEQAIRDLSLRILKHIGHEVEVAADGNEAVRMYKEALRSDKPFDIVILDLTVPGGLGGKETIKKLQKINSKVRAVVSSGYSNDPVLSYPERYGFIGVVSKPYSIEKMKNTLKKCLKEEL